jgi:hypothetical protein
MDRRAFIPGLGAVLATPLVVEAQQPKKVYRIAGLDFSRGPSADFPLLRERLHELGYHDGANLIFDYRVAEGEPGRDRGLVTSGLRRSFRCRPCSLKSVR